MPENAETVDDLKQKIAELEKQLKEAGCSRGKLPAFFLTFR